MVVPTYKVMDLTFTEVAPSVDMYARGYETRINDIDIAAIEEITNDIYDKNIVNHNVFTNELRKNNVNILDQSTTGIHRAPVINGWSDPRFAFSFILLTEFSGSGSVVLERVTGYTDICSVSGDEMDPDTTMFITGVAVFNGIIDNRGMIADLVMTGNYTVSFDETGSVNDYQVTRPEEITSRISGEGGTYISITGSLADIQLIDRSVIGQHEHIGRTLSTTLNVNKANSMIGNSADNMDVITGDLTSAKVTSINIFRAIFEKSSKVTTAVTITELDEISHIPVSPDVFMMGEETIDIDTTNLPDEGSEIIQPTYETKVMNITLLTVNELMDINNLDSVSFAIDNSNGEPNYTFLGMPVSVIEGYDALDDAEAMVNMFIEKVWNSISDNNTIQVSITVYMLGNSATISVAIDDGYLIPFIIPNAAHSKILPIMMDTRAQEAMGEDYREALNCIIGVTSNKARRSSSRIWS